MSLHGSVDQLKRLSHEYKMCKTLYQQNRDRDEKYKMEALMMQMSSILEGLSMDACVWGINRFLLQSTLDEVNFATEGQLRFDIEKVQGALINNGRAKFQGFCEHHDIKDEEKIASFARCIDFRHPSCCLPINVNDVMYQWCRINSNGEVGIGNWFSDTWVGAERLGTSPFYEVGIYYSSTTRLAIHEARTLFKFKFNFSIDSFLSTAAGAIDTWTVKHHPGGSLIEDKGIWARGGAVQYFIPLDRTQKEDLLKTATRVGEN